MNSYVVEKEDKVKTTVASYGDIGPEFNFMLKVGMTDHTEQQRDHFLSVYSPDNDCEFT